MADYINVDDARSMSGLRLVLTPGVPGPWSEAAKGIFDVKKLPYVRVAQDMGGENKALIEWSAPAGAKVYLQNFPIQGMPPDVRNRFLAKLRIQIGLAKKNNNIDDSVIVELIDAETRSVMETLQTETS